jgi:tRNA pseudouridine55 synthase
MCSLRRTRVGSFTLDGAVYLDDGEAAVRAGRTEYVIKPVDTHFAGYPSVRIDERQKSKCLNGNAFPAAAGDGLYRVYDGDGRFLMLGRVEGDRMYTVKSFFDV